MSAAVCSRGTTARRVPHILEASNLSGLRTCESGVLLFEQPEVFKFLNEVTLFFFDIFSMRARRASAGGAAFFKSIGCSIKRATQWRLTGVK